MTDYQSGADAPEELCPCLTQPCVTSAEPYLAQAATVAAHPSTAVLYPRRTEAVMAGPQSEATDDLCSHLTDAEELTAGSRRAKAAPTASPWVRPYVLTGGRTHTRDLLVHTLVSAPNYKPSLVAQLPPEARFLYERAHTHTESVAELSAHCGIPLGVTRVLLSDLVAAGHVEVGPDPYASPYDSELLERIIDGLQQFA